jgi:hypothetical protein
MSLKRSKIKFRQNSGSFLAIPHVVLENEDFINLSPRAIKLLFDIASQFRGTNNGDLCAAFSIMEKRGWKSKSLLANSLKELLDKNFILLTRQGGRKIPNLYALTWKAIDECGGKLDVSSTRLAPRSFSK